MSDLVTATRYATTDDEWSETPGRHAFNEDAVLTPIFHALTRGGWRSRQHEPAASQRPPQATSDPVDAFRRDPLTAPIPVQALVGAPAPTPVPAWRRRTSGAHALVPDARPEMPEQGRHHRRWESARLRR